LPSALQAKCSEKLAKRPRRRQIEAALAEAINSHAEGVETEAQRDMLRQLQCEEMQGFLPESPVSLALHDVVPHIITQSLHLRVRESESRLAKRLLQQYRHKADVTAATTNVCY
jgi:predicted signal transduction protein with EAL and GGDEF domain